LARRGSLIGDLTAGDVAAGVKARVVVGVGQLRILDV
jgi:hypothetical protein